MNTVPKSGRVVCIVKDEHDVIQQLGIVDRMGQRQHFKKKDVVNAIRYFNVVLVTDRGDGREGARLHQVNEQYLTTTPNDTTRDNLGELMSCAELDLLAAILGR